MTQFNLFRTQKFAQKIIFPQEKLFVLNEIQLCGKKWNKNSVQVLLLFVH